MQEMINRAKELLSDGTVNRVLGWRRGDMSYNPEPSYLRRRRIWTQTSSTTASAARTSVNI